MDKALSPHEEKLNPKSLVWAPPSCRDAGELRAARLLEGTGEGQEPQLPVRAQVSTFSGRSSVSCSAEIRALNEPVPKCPSTSDNRQVLWAM